MSSDYLEHADAPKTALALRMERTERVLLAMRRDGLSIEDVHRAVRDGTDGGDPMPGVTLGQVATIYRDALRRRAQEVAESREEAREVQLMQFDQVIRVHTPKMRDGNAKSAELVMRAVDSKAKLQGTVAAERHEHTVTGGLLVAAISDPAEIQAEREAQIAAGFRPATIEGRATEVRR